VYVVFANIRTKYTDRLLWIFSFLLLMIVFSRRLEILPLKQAILSLNAHVLLTVTVTVTVILLKTTHRNSEDLIPLPPARP
jgi:hypothetical protein